MKVILKTNKNMEEAFKHVDGPSANRAVSLQ